MLAVVLALLVAAAAPRSEAAPSLGGFCTANSFSSSTTARTTTIAALSATSNLNSSVTYPSCLQPIASLPGFYTITGVVVATGNSKGLGYSATANQAWMTDPTSSATATLGSSIALYFGVIPNSVNRGDNITVIGYLVTGQSSLTIEVCSFTTGANLASNGALPSGYSTTVATNTFTNSTGVFPLYGATGLTSSWYLPSGYIGGLCTASTKAYDGTLVTLSNVKILPCNNSMTMAPKSNVMSFYSVCQPTLSPLADTYVTVSGSRYCTSCLWDKYSTWWVSSDSGATAVAVSTLFFRAFNVYNMVAGQTISVTGVMTYQSGRWTLIPRDLNDFTGLTAVSTAASLTAIIGDSTLSGVKQQTYQWASPGPTLSSQLDPNGATAAANLPIGVPAYLLGPMDLINNGSSTYYGNSSNYFPTVTIPGNVPAWTTGCPNASAFAWIYSQGQTSQALCDCFPPRYYSPLLGSNGGGTAYVSTMGIVTFIEGSGIITSGVASFYMASGPNANQHLYVYQDGSAGKSINLGDNVTILATAYSYYGLVEMQNTLNVVINSRGNAVYPPVVMPDLSALDVVRNGHCSATSVLYRANRVTFNYVTVTKVLMYELFPTSFQYWYNGSNVSPVYSTNFNNTIGKQMSNWYNSNLCSQATGGLATHPLTNGSFICTFEITDGKGNYALVDQCPYSSVGGLVPAFLGTDYAGAKPLAVGDTFQSITGVLKYSRGGTYREPMAGGNLMICATGDPSLLVGRNQPWPSTVYNTTVLQNVKLAGFTAAMFQASATLQTAFIQGIASTAGVPPSNVAITGYQDSTARRHLLVSAVVITYSVTTSSAQLNATTTALSNTALLTSQLTSTFTSANIPAPTIVGTAVTTTITTNNKSVLAVGLGVGIGGGCGVIILLGLLYRFVLKKKNIEQGQKSAVMMTPAGASA